jgi:hypothetical protein
VLIVTSWEVFIGVTEGYGLLGPHAVSLGKLFPAFVMSVLPSSSWTKWCLVMKAVRYFEMLGATYPVVQRQDP